MSDHSFGRKRHADNSKNKRCDFDLQDRVLCALVATPLFGDPLFRGDLLIRSSRRGFSHVGLNQTRCVARVEDANILIGSSDFTYIAGHDTARSKSGMPMIGCLMMEKIRFHRPYST
jgi:hypothetical protein